MFNNWFKKSKSERHDLRHDLKPQTSPVSSEIEAMLAAKLLEVKESSYVQYLEPLPEKVVGKAVIDTFVGTSGFVLYFSDLSWVGVYLESKELHWLVGQGKIPEMMSSVINSPEYGNGHDPIQNSKMYASQICDIGTEVSHSKGQAVTGLSYGSNCFNFCFPNSKELDTSIVPTSDGRLGLRVFWEQW